MAEYSTSSLPDLPPTTAETLQFGNPRVLGWVQEAVAEGDRINRSDPSYDAIERAQLYIVGEQLGPERLRLKYIPQTIINETRKAVQAHVSALTDIRPVFGWRTQNPAYKLQADLLNQYAVAEWVTQMFDLDLGDTIKYSLAAGTGDLVVDWDPHVPLGGANQLTARDPRDTLAIRPGLNKSIQTWQGLVLREEHTVNALRSLYPTKQDYFRPSTDTALSRVMGRFRTAFAKIITPTDPLDQLAQQAGAHTRQTRSGNVVVYRAYLHDRTRNLTSKPIPMGTPGSAFGYTVAPQGYLYPRGRLVVCTDYNVLYDGPNTYMHGRFPVCRLKLFSVPWQFLGIPLLNDVLPLQDSVNDLVNDVRLGVRQWMDPDIVYNRNAVSENTMRLLDPRRPGKRVKVQPGFGDPYTKQDGPSPAVLTAAIDLWEKLTTKFADLTGTANLSALMELGQLPSDSTIEAYHKALTPEIRQEARQVEAFMRDLAALILPNYFQYLSVEKRVAILGEAGQTLQDFDLDPNNMVPALKPGDHGYTPELDVNLTTRDQRAQYFHKLFVFQVAPNSIIAMSDRERKMTMFQLARMGFVDWLTLLETLEIPNAGAYPAMPLPPIAQPDPALIPQLLLSGKFVINPQTGQLNEMRVPITILERLMASNMLGVGMVASAPGRKSSGQVPPHSEEKSDGEGGKRQVVSESK